MLRWFEQTGECNDVVLSSRVRLARNINSYLFSYKISEEDKKKLQEEVFEKLDGAKVLKGYRKFVLEEMEEIQKNAYQERRVFSKFLVNEEYAGAFCSQDESISIMVNEEDHIRIQALTAGNNLQAAFLAANEIDDFIGSILPYSYDEHLGFLTTCPSNVGTGLKASVTLHLPALSGSRKIQALSNEVGRFGLMMHPVFSKKGNAEGHLYQVSNQQTLGMSEEEILENLSNIVEEIIEQERKGRQYFIRKERLRIEDEVYKSYGLLRYSRKMSLSDALLLLSRVRMGIFSGLIRLSEEQPFVTQQLLMGIQSANLQLGAGSEVTGQDLEALRATFLRENIPLLN